MNLLRLILEPVNTYQELSKYSPVKIRKIIAAAIIYGCCVSFNVVADEIILIQSYIRKHFPASFKISNDQLKQLHWVLKQDNYTNDQDLYVPQQGIHIEIRRALTRLYCAQLLRSGTMDSYNKFVTAQLDADVAAPLSFTTFNKLAKFIANFSESDYELLETATILAAVSLSQPAAELAQQVMDITPVLNDKLDFMAATLRNSLDLYPLTTTVTQNNSAAKKLLYVLFPPQTNFHHMIYTEGGIGMFQYLRTMIAHGYIDQNKLDLLYANWIINISGFRGHISQQGSLYLSENVAQAVLKLQSLVYEMLEMPTYNPLLPYLEYRAEGLGLRDLPYNEKLFITHLACLLRLYTVAEGQRLYHSVIALPANKRTAAMNFFINSLRQATQLPITYAPALFGNALAVTNGDIEQVITKILPVYNAMLLQHLRSNSKVALSFNRLSAKHNIKHLLRVNAVESQRLHIDANGNVILTLND